MMAMVWTSPSWPFYGPTVEDELELHSEVTPDAQSRINVRLKDGRSVIIREDETLFYQC